jgi:plastocyanin
MKKILAACVLLALLTLTLVSCTITGNDNTSTTGNTVGLGGTNFTQSSITIKKGTSVTLVNQANVVHIISNGSWQGDTPDSQTEPGAPVINNVTINSPNQTQVIGPFNTAGTFHYYCIVHDGMNLTVIVQ